MAHLGRMTHHNIQASSPHTTTLTKFSSVLLKPLDSLNSLIFKRVVKIEVSFINYLLAKVIHLKKEKQNIKKKNKCKRFREII